MGDESHALLCPKDRDMVQAGLVDELHHRIEQLGVPGVDDCLTLLAMLDKLMFTLDHEVNRQLTHMVMPLLKDGLGRLVERFCALEPGESDSECLSDAIQNYAKAISLIANWKFSPCVDAAPPAEAPAEPPCCAEEVKLSCWQEEVKPAAEPCAAEPCAEEPCAGDKPSDEPCCGEEKPER